MTRYVALDLETTSIDHLLAFPLEIAAVTYDPSTDLDPYGFTTVFVPDHPRSVIAEADPEALAVNRYFERRLFDGMSSAAETARQIDVLIKQLDGATLVGANPAYDAAVLWRYLSTFGPARLTAAPWHFRLFDVEVATRVALGLDYTPGLSRCLDLLDLGPISPSMTHTALGDGFAALDVFHELEQRRADS